jgi:hypothetical protein
MPGKKRTSTKSACRRPATSKRARKPARKSTKKQAVVPNPWLIVTQDARDRGLESFKYNGKTYKKMTTTTGLTYFASE